MVNNEGDIFLKYTGKKVSSMGGLISVIFKRQYGQIGEGKAGLKEGLLHDFSKPRIC